jgi:hypothetical protein
VSAAAWRQNKYFKRVRNEKTVLLTEILKYFSQTRGNSISNSDFSKLIITVTGYSCGYLPCAPENVAMPPVVIIALFSTIIIIFYCYLKWY